MAFNAQGTYIFWSATTAASTAAAQAVGQVVGFNGPTGSAPVIDGTHLASVAKEKTMGLRDEGQVTLDVFFVPNDTVQTALRADRASRSAKKAVIKLSDSTVDAQTTKITFDAYCTGYAIQGAVDQNVKGTVTLEIIGACTFSSVIT